MLSFVVIDLNYDLFVRCSSSIIFAVTISKGIFEINYELVTELSSHLFYGLSNFENSLGKKAMLFLFVYQRGHTLSFDLLLLLCHKAPVTTHR